MGMTLDFESLLDIALNGPEIGRHNLSVLHGLLREVFKHMNLSKKKIQLDDDNSDYVHILESIKLTMEHQKYSPGPVETTPDQLRSKVSVIVADYAKNHLSSGALNSKPPFGVADASFIADLKERVACIESELKMFQNFPSVDELKSWAKSKSYSDTIVTDLWHFVSLNHRMSGAEEGILRLTELVDQLLPELKKLLEDGKVLNQEIKELQNQCGNLVEFTQMLQNQINQADSSVQEADANIINELSHLKDELSKVVTISDLNKFATKADIIYVEEQARDTVAQMNEILAIKAPVSALDDLAKQDDVNRLQDLIRDLRSCMNAMACKDDVPSRRECVTWSQLEKALKGQKLSTSRPPSGASGKGPAPFNFEKGEGTSLESDCCESSISRDKQEKLVQSDSVTYVPGNTGDKGYVERSTIHKQMLTRDAPFSHNSQAQLTDPLSEAHSADPLREDLSDTDIPMRDIGLDCEDVDLNGLEAEGFHKISSGARLVGTESSSQFEQGHFSESGDSLPAAIKLSNGDSEYDQKSSENFRSTYLPYEGDHGGAPPKSADDNKFKPSIRSVSSGSSSMQELIAGSTEPLEEGCAARRSSKDAFHNDTPSSAVTKSLKQIGRLPEKHLSIENALRRTRDMLTQKVDRDELDKFVRKDDLDELGKFLSNAKNELVGFTSWRDKTEGEIIPDLRNGIESLENRIGEVIELTKNFKVDKGKTERQIDNLFTYVDRLEENKVDRTELGLGRGPVESAHENVPDKEASPFVTQYQHDNDIGRLSDSMKDILNKLDEYDKEQKKNFTDVMGSLQEKIEREELTQLRENLENRFKVLSQVLPPSQPSQYATEKMRLSLPHVPAMPPSVPSAVDCEHPRYGEGFATGPTETAAAFRSQMKFNCLSCNRPLSLQTSGHLTSRGKPYSAAELDQLRQLQKILKGESSGPPNRPCGGVHTTVPPAKRITARMSPTPTPDDHSAVLSDEVDLEGVDGKLYRGVLRSKAPMPHNRTKSAESFSRNGPVSSEMRPVSSRSAGISSRSSGIGTSHDLYLNESEDD